MPRINLQKTGENITRLRKEANLSVKDLQMIFGFGTPQAIYKWEQGAALPAIDNLVYLSVIFETSIDSILIIE
ncbi:MAG: helix-turn-helix domain-containing protein [Lachnospiraceae bacterium]|nr:helix-turn-helix domain-containing protein [Lachnospiraceae bacterium]